MSGFSFGGDILGAMGHDFKTIFLIKENGLDYRGKPDKSVVIFLGKQIGL